MTPLRTPRLLLRAFRDDDAVPLAAMGADARVMEYLPGVLTRAESDALLARLRVGDATRDLGAWAVEAPGVAPFTGFILLKEPGFAAPFQPCVEIGWRFAVDHWGKGYATEAAWAALAHGFDTLDLAEIVSFTVPENERSRRVMERLGMRHDEAGDFDHPSLPTDHRLLRHVLYRLGRQAWRSEGSRL